MASIESGSGTDFRFERHQDAACLARFDYETAGREYICG
jgi:hypothetical protein